jgi:hypothetical protein
VLILPLERLCRNYLRLQVDLITVPHLRKMGFNVTLRRIRCG